LAQARVSQLEEINTHFHQALVETRTLDYETYNTIKSKLQDFEDFIQSKIDALTINEIDLLNIQISLTFLLMKFLNKSPLPPFRLPTSPLIDPLIDRTTFPYYVETRNIKIPA